MNLHALALELRTANLVAYLATLDSKSGEAQKVRRAIRAALAEPVGHTPD